MAFLMASPKVSQPVFLEVFPKVSSHARRTPRRSRNLRHRATRFLYPLRFLVLFSVLFRLSIFGFSVFLLLSRFFLSRRFRLLSSCGWLGSIFGCATDFDVTFLGLLGF